LAQLEKGNTDKKTAVKFTRLFSLSAILNAAAISTFMISLIHYENGLGHYTPLTMLFIATMYAVVNYHQLASTLVIRVSIYAFGFLYISLHDIWLTNPPLSSYMWLELGIVLCVLYFIIDFSRSFLRLYMKNLEHLFELEHQRHRAENLYQLQSQFIATVSHELRTPMTSIMGALSLIESGQAGNIQPKTKALIDIANKNSVRLAALINDVLDVQKFESGKMAMEMSRIDLSELVRDAVDANASYESAKNVKFETSGLEHAIYVNADYDRVMQVMANVLSNSVKFSNNGGTVEVSLETDASVARISIKDHGKGIPEGAENKVFAQFEQVDGSDVRKAGGTGLGMYISKKIMEGHAGNIDFTSDLGNGTTFYIELQLANPK